MIIGLALVYLTGWAVLDSLLAALVALNILWSGWGVIRDSVGGLMDVAVPTETQKGIREVIATNAEGALVFPTAVIRMSAPEWRDLQATAEQAGLADLVAAITPQVEPFEPGARLTPAITAVPLAGHTPGHSGFEITSGDERLLYFGDAMHSSVISVRRPELVNAWDSDSDAAVATRQDLLERGAEGSLRYYGVHFPYPGIGRIEQRDGADDHR